MSDIIGSGDDAMVDFEGGFLDEAGVDVQSIADDPFNFGNAYWPVVIDEFRMPKVSDKGKFGSYMFFKIEHPRYERIKFGAWLQIPTPKAVQQATGVLFNPKSNPEDQAVAYAYKMFVFSLGYDWDVVGKVGKNGFQGRQFAARLRAIEEDGFWKPRFAFASAKRRNDPEVVKSMGGDGSMDGLSEFAQQSSGNSMDAIKAALESEQNQQDQQDQQ